MVSMKLHLEIKIKSGGSYSWLYGRDSHFFKIIALNRCKTSKHRITKNQDWAKIYLMQDVDISIG